jgi:hypothetical protein
MKKRLILLLTMTGMAWLAAAGCSEKKIDTAQVRAAFTSLTGEARKDLDDGLAAIDQSNYVAAVKPLQKVEFLVKMDQNQRLLLKDTLAKVEAKAARQK